MSLGIMASNSYYPLYDEGFPAIESEIILDDLLRGQLKFEGVVTSDALWVGKYEELSETEFNMAISQMILAGTDQLMIASSRFLKSYDFFKKFYNGAIEQSVSNFLIEANALSSRDELISLFRKRVDESALRVNKTKAYLQGQVLREDTLSRLMPNEVSVDLWSQYKKIIDSMAVEQTSL